MGKSKIYLVRTQERRTGARRCLEYVKPLDYSGKRVYVKPNFNSADLTPGSTHNDTLDELLSAVRSGSPLELTVGERSGPASAAEVFTAKGIPALCEKYGAKLINFEELADSEWVDFDRAGLHWPGGFQVPSVVLDADAVAATCCLKTHGFGGVFSNSLKLAVGLVPKDFPKLHNSPHMRKMIAEINLAYKPDFVLVDAVEVFTDGGPMQGVRKNASVMYIGSDRVALDLVGLAILKSIGSNSAIMNTPAQRQEQIIRAVELGLGRDNPDEIEIITDDAESAVCAKLIMEILKEDYKKNLT